MLSGEGSKDGETTTIGPISKKFNFAPAAHFFCTFLCRCFARLQRETFRNSLLVLPFLSSLSHASRRSILWICSGYMLSSHA